MKILYVEDNDIAAKMKLRMIRNEHIVDDVPNIARAWSLLENDESYEAIVLDLELGQNQDLFFEDEVDKKAVIEGQFAGYVFYKSVILRNFEKYKDKVLFITAYYDQFKKTITDPSEFAIIKNKLIDKREFNHEKKLFDYLEKLDNHKKHQ